MNSLLATIMAIGVLPTPQFASRLPTPHFSDNLPAIRLVLLPGPRNHFRCSHCGSATCLMFLGDHLKRTHGYSIIYLDRVGYKRLSVLHDNIHNRNWRPPPKTTVQVQSSCPTCKGGSCNIPILRRWFR